MKICAIIPSHNHWTAIGQVIGRLQQMGLAVFVIDDGSGALAATAVAKLHAPEKGVVVHRFPINKGKGAAVIEGFHMAWAAGFTHAVQIDADGQHDLDALPALLARSVEHPTALVSGQPLYDQSIPTGRKIGRWITHFWVLVETQSLCIMDSMCGFRVYPLGAVRDLLAKESVGQRMDFDTDILVRLFWRGTPVEMVPVKVVYPPGNMSNFDLLKDNWRISKMHTQLVLTLLWRMVPARQASRHWAGMAERGAYWGLRFCTGAYRLLGRRGCLMILAPIVLYFFLAGGEQRRASRVFLSRALNRPPTWAESYRHFLSFADRALDSFIAWTGGIPKDAVRATDPEGLSAFSADARGAVLVVAHLGNVDLARALLDKKTQARLTVLVHTRHAVNYNRVLREFCPEAAMNLIQVTEIGPATAIDLKTRVEQGEWIVIAGDRTPVLSQARVSRVPFLGADAAFSHGPWVLAALLDCPVRLLFCLREGNGWRLSLEAFADKVELPRGDREGALRLYAARYAARLEDYARRVPFQWYNFFDFWAG